MMTLVLAFAGVARADELTVFDGTATNGYVPLYGFYADAYLKAEYVIPAADLAEMGTASINGMTFYTTQSSVSLSSNFQVYLSEVDFTTLYAFNGIDYASLVYEGTISVVDGQMHIQFAEPYEYGGGNLFVAFYSTTTGNYSTTTWYGVSATGASVQGYSYNGLDAVNPTQRDFLPKTSFDYEPSIGNCEKPYGLAISEITPHTALFEWYGGISGFNVEYKKATDDEWIRYGTNIGWNCLFVNLDPNTTYQARVESVCEDGVSTSGFKTISFTTLESCPAPTNLTVVELTANSATLTWTPGNEETEWKLVRTTDGGFIPGITDNTYTIQGLIPDVINTWAVVAVCDEDDESAWSNTVTFEPTDKVVIGLGGTGTNQYLPTYTYYCYSLTQQIYTAEEIGMEGMIMSVDFYNASTDARTRSLDIYMVNTDKVAFGSSYDWVTATESDLVFSGEVTFAAQSWTTIELDEAFAHNGESNMALIVDDNTGSYESSINFYAFDAPSQAIRIYSDGTNYQPLAPDNYSGTILNQKNQIRLNVEEEDLNFYTVNVTTESEYMGSVSGSGLFAEGRDITITAMPRNDAYGYYRFLYWTDGNGVNIEDNPYTFTLTENVEFVAHFEEMPMYSPTVIVNPEGTGSWSVAFINHIHPYEGDIIIFDAGPLSDLYYFVNWTDLDGNIISEAPEFSYVLMSDVTFIANFAPIPVNLAVNPETLDLGPRPNGAWMRPYTFALSNLGFPTEIESVETNDDYFTVNMGDLSAPFSLDYNQSVTLGMEWGEGAGVVNADFIVNYEDTEAAFPVTALAYAPVAGDVWETAIEVNNFPYTATVNATNAPYYNNYVMPYPNIPDGYDVVYKLTFDQDTYLNASVLEDATAVTNGKVALYPEGFIGVGGPDERNNYTNPTSSVPAAPFDVQIGEGTNTSGYFPFYTYYEYSIAENLFLADELREAGVTAAPMTSLSWYATNETGYEQQGISIWMANVSDTELTGTSHTVNDMTLVYTGAVTPVIGWNEFVFNKGSFAWDGQSNVLIFCQRNNGSWNSTVYWQGAYTDFTATSYRYQDGQAYDVTVPNYMNTGSYRANIIMKSGQGRAEIGGNRDNMELTVHDGTTTNGYVPLYGLWADAYLKSETVYPAEELAEMAGGQISSMRFYSSNANVSWGNANFQVFMMEVDDATISSYYGPENATTVYEGSLSIDGNEMYVEFTEPYLYEGGNLLVGVYNTNPDSYSSSNWYGETVSGASVQGYNSSSLENVSATQRNFIPKTTFTYAPSTSYGQIVDMTVVPGTYYLVASATTENFTVNIETSEVPCPEDPTLVAPVHHYIGANPNNTRLKWRLDDRATEYSLRFGTDPDNMETIVAWTNTLVQGYTVRNLNYSTAYYWQVLQRNDGCTEGVEGPVWMFVTEINAPTNLYSLNGDEIMEGDVVQLYWTAPQETTRQLLYYNVIGYTYDEEYNYTEVVNATTTDTYYEVSGLITNFNSPYYFYVDAVYDIGLPYYYAASSYTINIYVNNLGTIEGHVYEQDGTTGIANASVTVFGFDYWGFYKQYYFNTDEDGYFNGEIQMGSGYSAYANAVGYQEAWYDGAVAVLPDSITSDINIIMDEVFWPVQNVVARYYPDADAFDSDAVQVNWTYFAPDANTYTFENGMEGWTTIDADGDGWNWMLGTEVMSSGQGHNGSNDLVLSQSWNNTAGVLYPDNYLVSPQVELGGQLHFFACAQDVNYAAEHFGVAVSTSSNTNPDDFTMLQEWTMSAKSVSNPMNAASPITTADNAIKGHSRGGNNRAQGTWYEYTVDLSAYSGMGYVAIRHFNCADMFYLDIDDININAPCKGGDRSMNHYRVYRTDYFNYGPFTAENTVLVADNVTETSYIDETFGELPMGTYKYGVSCVYEGNRESRITWIGQRFGTDETESQKIARKLDNSRYSYSYNFDDGTLQDWTTIDADGDGYTWVSSTNPGDYHNSGFDLTNTGHDGSAHYVISASYANGTNSVLYPDNYLVSPQVILGGSITFWANAQDVNYAAEHFGVAVSTMSDNNPYDFMTIQEWTLSAKGTGNKANPGTTRSGNRVQGNWYEYTVDLSAFAGQSGYVAIRHFNCYDQFILNIDDITISEGGTPLQGPRESEIIWSNPMDRDMYLYNNVDITVTLNSGDSPEGTVVSLVNQDWNEQQAHPIEDVVLDGSGHYAWDWFRKGDYYVTVSKEGYETISEYVSIYEPTALQYQLEEIMTGISGLYVSRTGWAMWKGPGNDPMVDANQATVIITAGDVWGDGTGYQMLLDKTHSLYGSTIPIAGALSTSCSGNEYLYDLFSHKIPTNADGDCSTQNIVFNNSVAIQIPAGTYDYCITNPTPNDQIWIAGGYGPWPARYDDFEFEGGNTYEFVMNHYGSGDGTELFVNGVSRGVREQNPTPAIEGCRSIGDVVVNESYSHKALPVSEAMSGDRHLEAVQVILSDLSGNVLYEGETENDYKQLPVENLVEGQTYHLAVGSVYSSGLSNWDEVDWMYESCDNYEGVTNLIGQTLDNGVLISWDFDYDNFITDDTTTYRSDNTLSINAELLCFDGQIVAHEANTNAGQGELGPNYSCLMTTPNPAWYYLRIDNPGDIYIYMYSTPTVDIDFCCWGPFNDPISPCPYGLTEDKVVSCSYSANASEYCYIPSNAQTGEYYILVLTNYSNQPCNFYFEQRGGSGSTNCSGYSTDGGFLIFRDGEWVGFTSDNSWLDARATNTHEYEIRVAYPGMALCPDENFYFSMSCPQTVEVMGPVVTQTTRFAEGWTWWSTYVDQERIDGLSLLEEGLGSNGVMVKSQNDGFVSYQEGTGWYGSLDGINNENTYQVKTSAACTVSMTTEVVVAEEHPITLNPGWSWVGYPSAVSLSLTNAMANHEPAEGDMMKSQEGYAMFYPELGWIGSLRTLIPGMGLMYHSNGTTPVSLTYASSARAGETEENITARGNRWEPNPNAYPDNMTVLAVVELDGMELASGRYELAAFANDVCLGSAKLMKVEALNRHMAFLTIYGAGDAELNFGLYDAETGMVTFESDERLDFVVNAITGDPMEPYVVSFRSTTGLDEHDANVNVYPNPVDKGNTFSLDLPANGSKVQVDIINALGVVVESVSTPTARTMKAPETAGVYTLRITVDGNRTYIRKLIVR